MKRDRSWRWAASGKHPSINDYIRIGRMFYLASGFSEWLRKGYSELRLLNSSAHPGCSWRFWVRGKSQNELSCGLVKDSSDSMGRPYPLLIMGSGLLEGWERNWDQVPAVCDAAWIHMETLSTQTFGNLKELEQELASMQTPLPLWSSSRKGGDVDLTESYCMSPSDFELFNDQLRELSEKRAGFIILDRFNLCDKVRMTQFIGTILGRNLERAPNTVFIGGTKEAAACYAFFRRPLTVSDFSTLWKHLPQRLQGG
jgi:type VI secretion system protein VasJ